MQNIWQIIDVNKSWFGRLPFRGWRLVFKKHNAQLLNGFRMKRIISFAAMAVMMAWYCHAAVYTVGSVPLGAGTRHGTLKWMIIGLSPTVIDFAFCHCLQLAEALLLPHPQAFIWVRYIAFNVSAPPLFQWLDDTSSIGNGRYLPLLAKENPFFFCQYWKKLLILPSQNKKMLLW